MVRLRVPSQERPSMSVGVSGARPSPLWTSSRSRSLVACAMSASYCSVARPDAGQFLESLRAASVDGRLDQAEDRALRRGGGQDLLPAVLALLGLRRFLLAGDPLPDLLEDRARKEAADHAGDDSERLVEELHRYFLRRSRRRMSAASTPPTTAPTGTGRCLTCSAVSATFALTWSWVSFTCSLRSSTFSWTWAFTSAFCGRASTVSPSSSRSSSISSRSTSGSLTSALLTFVLSS